MEDESPNFTGNQGASKRALVLTDHAGILGASWLGFYEGQYICRIYCFQKHGVGICYIFWNHLNSQTIGHIVWGIILWISSESHAKNNGLFVRCEQIPQGTHYHGGLYSTMFFTLDAISQQRIPLLLLVHAKYWMLHCLAWTLYESVSIPPPKKK